MSDKLARHLQLRTPLLWATTDEPLTVIDAVAVASDRPVFRMDIIDGLLTYQDDKWVRVLGPNQDPEGDPDILEPITDFDFAMRYVLEQKGVMLILNAHDLIKPLTAFLNHISEKWYRGFDADDIDKMPPSIILLSHKSEIPEEFKRVVVGYDHPLPSENELSDLVKQMIKMGELPNLTNNGRKKVTRAGVGLSRFEFMHTVGHSLAEHGKIDPETINARKLAILAKDGVLSMRTPKLTMLDIGGMDRAKHIMHRTTWIWNHPDEAEKLGIEPLRRILLIGVPGSGKSALCEATSGELGLELAKFGVGAMMNKFVGESEANMRRAFAQVQAMAPLCLWIDELGRDFSGGQSSGAVDGGTTDRVHGELLSGLQDLPPNVFLVCAANRIDDLPPEMLRADRFDKILFVGFPTPTERVEIFKIHLGRGTSAYDLDALAMATPSFTGAEIKALIKETRFEVSADKHRAPTTEEIIEQAQMMKGLVWNNHRAAIQEMHKRALNEWDWASTEQRKEAEVAYKDASTGKPRQERRVPSLSSAGNIFKS